MREFKPYFTTILKDECIVLYTQFSNPALTNDKIKSLNIQYNVRLDFINWWWEQNDRRRKNVTPWLKKFSKQPKEVRELAEQLCCRFNEYEGI